ncbi:MAG: hypothetical protein PUP92_40030, partial [Rhizonema sp. PD38]|nr:hypothetical protein [Rhizonema sp. PD38]
AQTDTRCKKAGILFPGKCQIMHLLVTRPGDSEIFGQPNSAIKEDFQKVGNFSELLLASSC